MKSTDFQLRRVRVTAPMPVWSAEGAVESMLPGGHQSREAGDSVLLCDDEGHVLSQLPATNFWGSVAWRKIVFLSW